MKIFLDVGGYIGETLEEVTKPIYGFDKIYCFEPASVNWGKLSKFNIELCKFGLWNKTTFTFLYGSGFRGASLYSDRYRNDGIIEDAYFIKASRWFNENLNYGHDIYMKLNCEAAECDILEDLIDSGEINKLKNVMVDFDVRKFPSQRHREGELMRKISTVTGVVFNRAQDVMIGRKYKDRIVNWLKLAGVVND